MLAIRICSELVSDATPVVLFIDVSAGVRLPPTTDDDNAPFDKHSGVAIDITIDVA